MTDDSPPADVDAWAVLDLDEPGRRLFQQAARGYGVELYGGTPEQRHQVLAAIFDEPTWWVDGRTIDTAPDFYTRVVEASGVSIDETVDTAHSQQFAVESRLEDTGANLIIEAFDAMPGDVQTDVAQSLKGIAEALTSNTHFGFTSQDGGAVVRAEPDLRMRVRSYELTPRSTTDSPSTVQNEP